MVDKFQKLFKDIISEYDQPSTSKKEPPVYKAKICDSPIYRLLKKQKEDLKEIFEMLNDGSGTIRLKDLQEIFKASNFLVDDVEMASLFNGIRTDEITAENLVTIMENKLAQHETKTDLKRIFASFDYDHKGYISLENLKRLSYELGIDVNEEEMQVN
ncbi:hypothetical protein O3M35_006069 [Rhynocoris fuscipes]|uniref:EF-hand domain-containing protein n=1 Tax=Rhynocoris fuscipes TaxID=488301 RepID=A0AAW1DCL2_9HEMI